MNVCPQDSRITPCTGKGDSDRWCCGDSNSCCKSNIGVISLAQVLGAGVSSSSSSSSSLSSVGSPTSSTRTVETVTETTLMSASSTIRTDPAESAHQDEPKSVARGVIAIIVIAAIAGIMGIGAGCWFVRRRLRKTRSQAMDGHGPVVTYKVDAYQAPEIHEAGVAETKPELDSHSPPYELASEPSELDSSESRPSK